MLNRTFYDTISVVRREKYILNEHEIDIDIDTGTMLLSYVEFEVKDKEDIENILGILGCSFEDTVSCTVDEIYKEIDLDINNMKELKF